MIGSAVTISKKLISGLVFITAATAAIGLASTHFISRINADLNQITDITAPTVETADDLRANIWESTALAKEILSKDNATLIENLNSEFNEFITLYKETDEHLKTLVQDPELLSGLQRASDLHTAFASTTQTMVAARLDELDEKRQANALLESFDAIGAALILGLDEFAIENEQEMQAVEDEGDRLVATGLADPRVINTLLGDLFDQDYPVVEAALKLQRLVIEMQDQAGAYMAAEDARALAAISENFARLAASADGHFTILERLAETPEDAADTERLKAIFARWVAEADEPEQLFDTHRDRLESEALSKGLADQIKSQADAVADAVDVVATAADDLNASADENAAALVDQAITIIAAGAIAAFAAAVLLILFTIKAVTQPIGRMTHVMGRLADDDLDADIVGIERKDEIGAMARAVEVFKTNAIAVKRLDANNKAAEAEAEARKRAALRALADGFENELGGAIGTLTSSAAGMQDTAMALKGTADAMMASSVDVVAASEESSVNAASVASAMDQMVASIGEIAGQAARAQDRSSQTRDSAQNTSEIVDNLNARVETIGGVVTAIQDIAEQTNLLALNATIEAARAGDAGKGFAVVAEEVKKLANETAQKTAEINERIKDVQSATAESVEAVNAIIQNVSEIDQSITAVSAAIEQQNASSEEIRRNISQSAKAAEQVTEIISTVQDNAHTNGQSSRSVLNAAQAVAQLSQTIKTSAETFLNGVRNDNEEIAA